MSRSLATKNALVTGAGRGIGAAIAARLRADGATVLATDLTPAAGVVACDATDPDQLAEAVARAAGDGRLDICVANAGVLETRLLVDSDLGDWERILRVNVYGVAATFQAAARRMIADGGGGRLVTIASLAATSGTPGLSAYCASKAGVTGLIRCLAVELAPHGITVNGLAPGRIETDMIRNFEDGKAAIRGIDADELRAQERARIPLGAAGTPEDVANAVAFLASDDAAYVTGAILPVDGGSAVS